MSPRRTDSAEPAAIRRYDEMAPWALRAPRRRESDGVLLADGIVAREGVLTYQLADGRTRRELVTADALTSMARTLGRAAVTREHPPEFVSPDNVQQYGVGDTDGQPKVILDEAEGTKAIFYQVDLEMVDISSNVKSWFGQKKIKKLVERSNLRF